MGTVTYGDDKLTARHQAILLGLTDVLNIRRHVGDGGGHLRQRAALILHIEANAGEEIALGFLRPLDILDPVAMLLVTDVLAIVTMHYQPSTLGKMRDDRVAWYRMTTAGIRHHHTLGALDRQGLAGVIKLGDVLVKFITIDQRLGHQAGGTVAETDLGQQVVIAIQFILFQHAGELPGSRFIFLAM